MYPRLKRWGFFSLINRGIQLLNRSIQLLNSLSLLIDTFFWLVSYWWSLLFSSWYLVNYCTSSSSSSEGTLFLSLISYFMFILSVLFDPFPGLPIFQKTLLWRSHKSRLISLFSDICSFANYLHFLVTHLSKYFKHLPEASSASSS